MMCNQIDSHSLQAYVAVDVNNNNIIYVTINAVFIIIRISNNHHHHHWTGWVRPERGLAVSVVH